MEMDIHIVMHMLTETNGDDNQITMTVVSHEVLRIRNRAVGEGRRYCSWYEEEIEDNLRRCFELNK